MDGQLDVLSAVAYAPLPSCSESESKNLHRHLLRELDQRVLSPVY